ncbi:hypothetical protein ACFFQW_44475 [Umezawaea endophytica]|uniref:NB-ARC domain-containing protein n=1 Tax=Umezawaea endophytica TaxID=1654476 RepID=A0A9X2VXX0_9PSEU|nr:hypothetical protein [Umezawaea endophytica]MCS7484863.1 hypothetical protein [Umezawaea endophytica]
MKSAKVKNGQPSEPALGVVRAALTSLITGHPVLGLAGSVARLRVEPVGAGTSVHIDVAGLKPGPGRLDVRVLPAEVDDDAIAELMDSAPLDVATVLAVVGEGPSNAPSSMIKALRLLVRTARTTETVDEFVGAILRADRRSSAQRVLSVLKGHASTDHQRRLLHTKFRRMWIPRPVEFEDHLRVRPGQPDQTAQVSRLADEIVREWPRPADISAEAREEARQVERVFVVPQLGSPAENVTRRSVVEDLAARFADPRGSVCAAIVATSGMGKSALAVRLCHLLEENYRVVGWLSADDATAWRASVSLLAERLGLTEDDPAHVFDALVEHGPALIVVDDAPEPALLATSLPSRPGLHVLVTSQSVRWRSAAHVVELDPLTVGESVDYLLARTGAEDEDLARAVAERVSGHPFALEQAAAAVVDGISLRGWLERHHEKVSAPHSAWQVRIGLLREHHADALAVLQIISCAGKGAVPAELLAGLREDPDDEVTLLCRDTARRDAAVTELRSQGLIRTGADEETLLVHPLLAELIRDDPRFDIGHAALEVGAAAGDLIRELNVDDTTQWSRVLGLSSAAVAASRLVQRERERDPRLLSADRAQRYANHALWLPAAYLHERGNARGAYRARLLAIALHGDKVAAAAVRDWSGDVSDTFTDLDPAEIVPAGELGQVARGLRSQSVARWLNENSVLISDVDMPAAEAYSRRALEIMPRRAPSPAPETADDVPWRERVRVEILDNLGFLVSLGPRRQEALRIFDAGLRLQLSFPDGENDGKYTELVNDRALVLMENGHYVDARTEFTRALETSLDHLDPSVEHNIGNNVARTEHLTWLLRAAHERLRRGLDFLLDRHSPQDSSVLIQQCNLGLVAYDLGFTGEGFELVHGSWKTAADRLGENDRETMIRRMMLADLQVFRGEFADANEAVLADLRLTPTNDGTESVWVPLRRVQSAWLTGVAALPPGTARKLAQELAEAFGDRGVHAALALDFHTAWALAGSGESDGNDVRTAAHAVRMREASVGAAHPTALLARARHALLRSDVTGRPLRASAVRPLLDSLDSLHGPAAGGFGADLARHGQPPVDPARPGWEAGRLMHLLADEVVDLDAGEQLCWQANAGKLAALAKLPDAEIPLQEAASGSAALYGQYHPWTLLRKATAAIAVGDTEQLRTVLTDPLWT